MKYVIMRHSEDDTVLPIIPAKSTARIKTLESNGFKVVEKIKLDDSFKPVFLVLERGAENEH